MKITNISRNNVLASKIFISTSFLARLKGLLFFNSLEKNQAMILYPCNSVHTFFMRFPIDVLFVAKDKKVVKIVRNMRPFRATGLCLKSEFVIELASGVISLTSTSVGDTLQVTGSDTEPIGRVALFSESKAPKFVQ